MPERLDLVFARLRAAPVARSAREALTLVCAILEQVEDEFSGVPRDPNPGLGPDGRMYSPRADHIEARPDGSIRALTRRHEVLCRADGSIVVLMRGTMTEIFLKPGGET